jgi:hypothetical protein
LAFVFVFDLPTTLNYIINMKTKLFALLAILLGILAVVGGVAIGFGAIAYSIFIIVLMIKGTAAVTFWKIFAVVLCWVLGPFVGWIWGIFCGFLASSSAALSGPSKRHRGW